MQKPSNTVKQDYTCTIAVDATPQEAIDAIGRVSDWWAKNYKGRSQDTGDVFTVTFGETFVTFRIEVVPGKKVTWYVTDCNLHWLKDKKEWLDTQAIWEISRQKDTTQIQMTHIGLVPEVECYENCEAGWNEHIKESLYSLLTTGKGTPA